MDEDCRPEGYNTYAWLCRLSERCYLSSHNHLRSSPAKILTTPMNIFHHTKSILYGFLLVLLVVSPSLAQTSRSYTDKVEIFFTENQNPFPDNNIKSLSGKAAAELSVRGVLKGYPDGEFKGNNPVNRAEAAKFLLESRNQVISETLPENPFPDVITSEWYAPYVLECVRLGIIKGYPDGSFKPTNEVITAEFLKMIALTFGLETGLPYTYEDENDFEGAWFWDYAGAAQKYELFPHRTKKLRPDVSVTRSEMAVAIYQYLKNGPYPRPTLNTNAASTQESSGNEQDQNSEPQPSSNDNQPSTNTSDPQLQVNAESLLQNIYIGNNTFMALELEPSVNAEELKSVTLLINNPRKIKITKLTLTKEGEETPLSETTIANEKATFTLSESLTANEKNRFLVNIRTESGPLEGTIQVILPDNGLEILFPNTFTFDKLPGNIILPELTFRGQRSPKQGDGLSANGYPLSYPDAPNRLEIESGYIAYQENNSNEAVGLDFNFKSPFVRSVLKDFDVRGDTSQLEEFLIIFKSLPGNGSSINIGTCLIQFNNGGGSDNNCNDNAGTIDTSTNNSAALVAAALSNFTGINNYSLEIAQAGSTAVRFKRINTPQSSSLNFNDNTGGAVKKKITLPGRTNTISISTLVKQAELHIDGKIIAKSSAVLADRIQFRDVNFEMGQSINYNFEIIIVPTDIKSTSANTGDVIRLFIPANAFSTANNGSVQGFAGQEFNPSSSAETGQKLIVAEAVPLFEPDKATGTNLAIGLNEYLSFKLNKFGRGYVQIGSSLSGSQFQVKLSKSVGLLVDRCELREQLSGVIATAISTQPGHFSTDPYGLTPLSEAELTNANQIYATFTPDTFSSGRLMEANGSSYSIYCSVSNVPQGSTLQVSIDESTQQYFIDSGKLQTPLIGANNFKKLPLTGTPRSSYN